MTSLPEQLSAASTRQLSAQLDAQFRFFNTFTTQALDSAGRIASLNLSTSRDSVERSSRAMRELIGATQPRDLLALRSHAEEQMRSLFNYGRELFNIGVNAQPGALRTILPALEPMALAAPVVEAPVVEARVFEAPVVDAAPEAVQEPIQDVATAAVRATSESVDALADSAGQVTAVTTATTANLAAAEAPVQAAPEPFAVLQEEPIATADEVQATILDQAGASARQKPIAKAAGKGAAKAAAAPQPMAAPVEAKDTASVTRIGNRSKRRK